MFTFGREHEIKCGLRSIRSPADQALIVDVIHAVHDCAENDGGVEHLAESIRAAFVNGGSSVWEQTGSWLRKSIAEWPELKPLWLEFAQHAHSKVRFRAACFLNDMPDEIRTQARVLLVTDKSVKVSEMARARCTEADER